MSTLDPITAITVSLPPAEDYLMYLTILEQHMSPEILPTLENFLRDPVLTQNIGWDLIHMLLPLRGASRCLATIAQLGNPREVILKVTEELQQLDLDSVDEQEQSQDDETAVRGKGPEEGVSSELPNDLDGFCSLMSLLSILHPRIKTKHPSRFLSTTLMAILTVFRPSHKATSAVVAFVHAVFPGKKRPTLPGRQSSTFVPPVAAPSPDTSAPDPEAQDEDPAELSIQVKLLQSFITHILEEYVNSNCLEWSARMQEFFQPNKVVTGRTSLGEAFRANEGLQQRDAMVGQLVAMARDLGLNQYAVLFDAIYNTESHTAEYETEYPSTPEDIPLSQAGSLFLIISSIFSAVAFNTQVVTPTLCLFPDHAKLVHYFIGTKGPMSVGSEEPGVIDAVLAIGLWLEHNNHFVSGPLEDEDFLQHLQVLSLLSANNSSPTLRYAAHSLTASILYAHPTDRVRLTFIVDTLEECPFESLKGSAVSWLKHEMIIASDRKANNVFASTAALSAVQPYLFPDMSHLVSEDDTTLVQELERTFSFHMAVVNFLYFAAGPQYKHLVPLGMLTIVEEIYLGPLKAALEKGLPIVQNQASDEHSDSAIDLHLLGDRIALCLSQIGT